MRVAVVGPAHPQKGGVALHTSHLCRRLFQDHRTVLIRWRRPYPRWLYKGELRVPDGIPETAQVPVAATLDWWNPVGWWQAGTRLSTADVVVLVHVVPALVPALLTVRRAAGPAPRVVVIAHNVLPHERHPGDEPLVRALFDAADRIVVHSPGDEVLARETAPRAHVVHCRLPPHLPDGLVATPLPSRGGPLRVLQLGTVREYKGLTTLLDALELTDSVEAVVAGELWLDEAEIRQQISTRGLDRRVTLVPRYVSVAELNRLGAACDAFVLPYLSSTGSQNVDLARALGRPVVASRVGSFPEAITDGVDGLLVDPGDPRALALALVQMRDPTLRARLVTAAPDLDAGWPEYVAAVVGG